MSNETKPTHMNALDPTESFEESRGRVRSGVLRLEEAIANIIVGQEEVVRHVLTALFCGGHALLEGVPGLGKTLLVRTLSEVLQLDHKRIQFTPDLMPADILGTTIIIQGESGQREFRFEQGPVFTQVLLADEVNRAMPRTQSALLEAMQEASVTIGGRTHELDQPFVVLATQNPLEMEGTYPLPEAQLDRFMLKINVPYPSFEELKAIIDRTTSTEQNETSAVMSGEEIIDFRHIVRALPISEDVLKYALRLVFSTHPDEPSAPVATRKYVTYGASPRGAQALVLAAKFNALMAGRTQVDYEDIRETLLPVLRHRVILNFEANAAGVSSDTFLSELSLNVPDIAPSLRAEAQP